MSFVTEVVARRMATVPRTIAMQAPRSMAMAVEAPRAFTTSTAMQKSAVESAKDGLKGVDRAVSDKLVDGINIGRKSPARPRTVIC